MIKILNPYFKLARLHQPAGFLLLFWPCAYGIILATNSVAIDVSKLFLYLLGAISLRSVGCIINDIIDRKIDAQVERTKSRPLASGDLKLFDALALLMFFLSVGFYVWTEISFEAKIISLLALLLAGIYPFMKRVTNYPQVFLGIVFNLGALVAFSDLTGKIEANIYILYAGCIIWTVVYDTVYGHQDIKSDLKIGVKSTAITFQKNTKLTLFVLSFFSYFLISFSINNILAFINLSPMFLHLIYLVKNLDLTKPEECMKAFKANAFITGFLIFVGLYITQI